MIILENFTWTKGVMGMIGDSNPGLELIKGLANIANPFINYLASPRGFEPLLPA